jgi:hypothetical protein
MRMARVRRRLLWEDGYVLLAVLSVLASCLIMVSWTGMAWSTSRWNRKGGGDACYCFVFCNIAELTRFTLAFADSQPAVQRGL